MLKALVILAVLASFAFTSISINQSNEPSVVTNAAGLVDDSDDSEVEFNDDSSSAHILSTENKNSNDFYKKKYRTRYLKKLENILRQLGLRTKQLPKLKKKTNKGHTIIINQDGINPLKPVQKRMPVIVVQGPQGDQIYTFHPETKSYTPSGPIAPSIDLQTLKLPVNPPNSPQTVGSPHEEPTVIKIRLN